MASFIRAIQYHIQRKIQHWRSLFVSRFNQSGNKDFYALAESMPQIVWVTSADGRNIYINKQWGDYTGQTLEESYGHGWNNPIHPDDKKRVWTAWQNATKNGDKYSLECRLRRADGKYQWWLVQGVPLLNADKTIIKWIGTCTDIDELKLAKDTLIESEKFTLDVMDSLMANIAVLDPSGVILKVNGPWRNFAHKNSGATIVSSDIGTNYLSVVAKAKGDEGAAEAFAGLSEVLQGKRDHFRLEYPCHTPTEKRWFMMNVSQLKNSRLGAVVSHTSITELKLAEELLKEAEFNLNLALESSKMGAWWMDVKSTYTQMSPSMATLYGLSETFSGDASDLIAKFIYPDDRAELQFKVTEALHSLKPLYHEFRIIRADGEIRWHYLRSALSFDKEGKAVRLYGIQGDRTAGKLIGDKLRDSEERYRNLVADASDGIMVVSENGQIIYGNHQLEAMFGYSPNELINQPMELLVPTHLHTAHVKQRDGYLTNPIKRPMGRMGIELNGRRKDGSEFPVDIGLSPSDTQNGKIVTAIIRDVSFRKKREEQVQFLATASRVLAESFENDRNALKKMAELAVTEIADGCAVRLLGDDAKLHLAAVVHRDPEKQQIIGRLANLLEARGVMPSEVSEVLKTNTIQITNNLNEVRNASLNLEPAEQLAVEQLGEFNSAVIPLKVHGKMIGVLSIMSGKSKRQFEQSDIEFLESIGTQVALSIENARLYSKAQSAIKLREEILAIVSHDLRNPLSAIQMAGQLLPKIVDDKTKVLTFSEKILRSTDHMKRMIEDLMDFAKIQEGNLSIEKQAEEPKVVLETVLEMMKAQAEEKGLELSIEVSPKLPVIQYDKQRIAQALLNLVGNAIKFTEVGGHVHLAAVKVVGGVKFSVTDSGPGISEEDLPRIFDRYWQAKRSMTASAGLGLSITKGIIEAHGGQIKVESQLEKGSTFYFILPAQT